jgi:arylsulfatase A-like enzyme
LRHGKHEFYEGGIRVPFLVLGPGIEENSVCRQAVTGLDLLPTFADLADHSMRLPAELDGGSLVPLLRNRGQGAVCRSRAALVFHQAANRIPISAIRKGRYKLVKHWLAENPGDLTSQYVGEKLLELYDLSEDVEERRDLSVKMPERTKELDNELMEFLKEVHAETKHTRRKSAYGTMLKARGLGSSRTVMAKPEYKSPFRR